MVLEGDYQLGDWLVRPHTNTVVGPEGELHMEPKAMRVLSLLAERAGQVVAKQEILAEVWDGTFVSDEVLPNAVWEIRRVLGGDARKPIFIQTLPKKGYRLIVSVSPAVSDPAPPEDERSSWSRWRWRLAAALAAGLFAGAVAVRTHRSEATRSARTAEDPYPVFVAAFENHTGSDELTWLESGAPTMLQTALAEIPGLTVVSDESLERGLADTGDEYPNLIGRSFIAKHTYLFDF